MKLRTNPGRFPWKSAGLCILLALAPTSSLLAGDDASDPEAQRQQAVAQYVDGATNELDAFRQQIGAAARPDNVQECRDARAKLDRCTKLVASLKTADRNQFDPIKRDYENSRGELVKALQAAQRK
jgi:hypothetical protein